MTFDPSAWRVVVIGAGHSGVAACTLLLDRGVRELCVNDARPVEQWSDAARALAERGASLHGGDHQLDFSTFDLVVISPGVPPFPQLERAPRIWGEIELATRAMRHPAPIVAVGGTNGKSTVTTLLGALLATRGAVFAGGNLGEPLATHADERFAHVVLEVSSFQMERVETFAPKVALLLNVSDDHLDRYEDFAAYVHAKGNMFAAQGPDDLAVIPYDDPRCRAQATRGRAAIATFGIEAEATVRVEAEHLVDTRDGERYARAEIRLAGAHNALNVAAAIAAARACGVPAAAVREVLREFRGLPHRMELVRELAGVRYYDDSKGTNVGAVVTALRGLAEERCVLIAGGRDKEGSYAPLVRALAERGRAVVLIGEAAERIAAAVGEVVPVYFASTLPEAVGLARGAARAGDAVLLSPACSSFDMFRDYKQRGDVFAAAVRALD